MKFLKINSGGNDFICVDNRDNTYTDFINSDQFSPFLIEICKRGLSVGADGLIVAESPVGDSADIRARFFEPDGSEVELCGNGTACFVYWVVNSGFVKGPEISIETDAGITHGKAKEEGFCSVCVPDPFSHQSSISLPIGKCTWVVDYIVTGTPHAIGYVEKLETLDVAHWGKAIRHHERFERSVNANFVQVLSEGHIAVRTYEFGVEAETLACGTGSASAAMLTALKHNWGSKYLNGTEPVLVNVQGGTTLKVWFTYDPISDSFSDVCLETKPVPVYNGDLITPKIACKQIVEKQPQIIQI